MPEENTAEFDFKRFLGILKRRRYAAIAVALTVVSAFSWGALFWPKTYEASSTVFIERSALIDPLIKGVGVSNSMEERLRTLTNSITSRNIIERVIKKLGLDSKARSSEKFDGLVEGIRKSLKVTVKGSRGERDTDLFTISFKGGDPKTVRDVVNTLVSEYIEDNASYRRTDAYGAMEFIQSQLKEYKVKLEDSDKAIREFRERNPQMIPQSEGAIMTRMEGFQGAKIEAEIRLKELLRKRDSLRKQLSGEKELTVAFVTREGSPQARLEYLNNQLINLMTRYTERHPEIIKVKVEIEELKKQIAQAREAHKSAAATGSETAAINPIYQQLKEDLTKTETEIESLRARVSELSRQRHEAQGVLGRMPKEQEEWSKLQRDRNVFQKIYDDLLQKLESAKVSKDLELTDKAATFRVIDPAILPHAPVRPDRVLMTFLGIVLGAALGVGSALWLERIDRSLKDEESVEKELGLPVLGSIPKIIVESDMAAERRLDRKVYGFAGAYMLIICLLLAEELLHKYMGIRIIQF
ncbi:MAG TPA: XrtA system polysaccharide chain length determinant [Dissulfurispiraceae bacterium]